MEKEQTRKSQDASAAPKMEKEQTRKSQDASAPPPGPETPNNTQGKETVPKAEPVVPQNVTGTEALPNEEPAPAVPPRKFTGASSQGEAEDETNEDKKPLNCCQKMWRCIFNFFANDRIYGSVIGPHPTSFLFCCGCCYRRCRPECTAPFSYASISTKLQYFLMIIVITILSCFMIVPSGSSKYLANINTFYPCNERGVRSIWRDCRGHGGYFMVYRNFFALNFYYFCMALTMIGFKSTSKNKFRKKMHHGFWLYKYLILAVLLLISYTGIRVEGGGIFEMMMMSLGLFSTVLFSLVQLVLFLDVLELAANKNQKLSKAKAKIVDGLGLGIVTVLILLLLGTLCACYTQSLDLSSLGLGGVDLHILSLNQNLVTKESGKVCLLNVGCIVYLFVASLTILALTGIFRARLPVGSWLGSLCVILYNILLIWSAMENQENFACRPLWRKLFPDYLNPGNMDTYFKLEGFFHGVAALVALYYYLFWHGPRTDTAPLSIAFVRIMYRCSKRSEVPVMSDNRPTTEHLKAMKKFRVWDDEQLGVTYSWSMFYVFLILGSMTLCSAMTNFSNPWANLPMSSSLPAMCVKIVVSVITVLCYLWPILLPKSRCILPDDEV